MSEELKTLKDIDKECLELGSDAIVFKSMIKAEAIKWVKVCGCSKVNLETTCFGCRRFMSFFNITEKDLK